MKAITLHQPWATLIAEGVKTIETRGREHPWRSAIGQTIAIHAAQRPVPEWSGGSYHVTHDAGSGVRHLYQHDARRAFVGEPIDLPLGAVVATCTLVDVVPMLGDCGTDMGQPTHICGTGGDAYLLLHLPDYDPLDGETEFDVTDQKPFGDFAPGRYALLLDDVRKCAPFPVRGHQGLWTLPGDVADNLMGWAA